MKMAKRFTTLLMALLMVVGLSGITAYASGDTMVSVYIKAPADWKNPCIWAWDDAGKNAFAAWPGGAAEADTANEGWYYCWIPDWATNIIVNANEGTVQTGDLKLEGKNTWLTITAPETVDISYEAKTTGSAPAYVEKITVHAKVPTSWTAANLWAWSAPDGTNAFAAWPGAEMKLADDGWYNSEAPAWINSIIVLHITAQVGFMDSAEK